MELDFVFILGYTSVHETKYQTNTPHRYPLGCFGLFSFYGFFDVIPPVTVF